MYLSNIFLVYDKSNKTGPAIEGMIFLALTSSLIILLPEIACRLVGVTYSVNEVSSEFSVYLFSERVILYIVIEQALKNEKVNIDPDGASPILVISHIEFVLFAQGKDAERRPQFGVVSY